MPSEQDLGERIEKLMENLETMKTESEEREQKRNQIAEQELKKGGAGAGYGTKMGIKKHYEKSVKEKCEEKDGCVHTTKEIVKTSKKKARVNSKRSIFKTIAVSALSSIVASLITTYSMRPAYDNQSLSSRNPHLDYPGRPYSVDTVRTELPKTTNTSASESLDQTLKYHETPIDKLKQAFWNIKNKTEQCLSKTVSSEKAAKSRNGYDLVYLVKKNETLYGISKKLGRYGPEWRKINEDSGRQYDPHHIQAGEFIVVTKFAWDASQCINAKLSSDKGKLYASDLDSAYYEVRHDAEGIWDIIKRVTGQSDYISITQTLADIVAYNTELNPSFNPDKLHQGQQLHIPRKVFGYNKGG